MYINKKKRKVESIKCSRTMSLKKAQKEKGGGWCCVVMFHCKQKTMNNNVVGRGGRDKKGGP